MKKVHILLRTIMVLNGIFIILAMINTRDRVIKNCKSELVEATAYANYYEQIYKNPGNLFVNDGRKLKNKQKFVTAYAVGVNEQVLGDSYIFPYLPGDTKFINDILSDTTDMNISKNVATKKIDKHYGSNVDKFAFFKAIEQQNGFLSPRQAHSVAMRLPELYERDSTGWITELVTIPVENNQGEKYLLQAHQNNTNGKFWIEVVNMDDTKGSDVRGKITMPI